MLSLDGFGPTLQAIFEQLNPVRTSPDGSSYFHQRWSETQRLISHLTGSMNLLWLSCARGFAMAIRGLPRIEVRRFLIIAGLWFFPPLLFFAAVHFGQIGYLLLVLPVPCVLSGGLFHAGQLRIGSGVALGTLLISNLILFSTDLTGYLDPRFRSPRTREQGILMLRDRTPALFGLNRGILAENDHRLGAFRECITQFSPLEVMVLSGPNSPSQHRVHWPIPIDEVYRNLAAELPAYRILVPSREAQAVLETHQYRTMLHETIEFELPASVRHLVATVDSIPAACSPSGIEFERLDFGGQSCFVAEVDGPFSYCGIRFVVVD